MAKVETIDITSMIGSENFPVNINDVYGLIETIASQNIRSVKSTNKIQDGLFYYDVENGTVIEEAVFEMAKGQAFDKNAYSFAPTDPVVHPLYFNNWEASQYATTVRRNDIRKIIANKGVGIEEVISTILDTLTQGEGYDDFKKSRNLILNAPCKNYRAILGGVPKTMRGVIYAARDMYNHVKSDNADLTSEEYVSSVPESDIRVAITSKLLNLVDVGELAHVFNLSKEELFGKLVVVDVDDLPKSAAWYKIVVYDRKAMGRGRRLFEYSQDVSGKGLFTNHYLTDEMAFFYNGLFKACWLDCSKAAESALADLVDTPATYTVTNTLLHCTSNNAAATTVANEPYVATITASAGYKLEGATVEIKMGGADITSGVYKDGIISISSVSGNIEIKVTAVSA